MALPWSFGSKNTNSKHQNTNTMPKAGKNLKFQYSMTETFQDKTLFGFSNFGHWNLSFDFAQDGEPVEPFDIWDLIFGISINQ